MRPQRLILQQWTMKRCDLIAPRSRHHRDRLLILVFPLTSVCCLLSVCRAVRVHEMNNSMLPAGAHSFPFKWQLPAALPGSFYERVALDAPSSAEFKDRDLVADWPDSDDEDGGKGNDTARASVFGTVHYKIKAVRLTTPHARTEATAAACSHSAGRFPDRSPIRVDFACAATTGVRCG